MAFVFLLTFLGSPILVHADTIFASSTAIEDAAMANGGIYNLTLSNSPYIFNNGVNIGDINETN